MKGILNLGGAERPGFYGRFQFASKRSGEAFTSMTWRTQRATGALTFPQRPSL
jgi:hypothetical protein